MKLKIEKLQLSCYCYLLSWFSKLFVAQALFEQCNHRIELIAGQKVYINSPYYPAQYPIGTSCRYTISAPLDYELSFKCNIQLNVRATSSTRCQHEIFYFNREGSELLSGSDYVCTTGKLERNSFLNRAVISYISMPLYKRNLIETLADDYDAVRGSNNNSSSSNSDEVNLLPSTTATTGAPPYAEPTLNISEEGFENAFTYLTTLLTEKTPNPMEVEGETDVENNDESVSVPPIASLPMSVWRKPSKRHQNASKRGRIVSGNGGSSSNYDDSSYYGYIDNRGGGSFSCLVEVVEPPCDCGWSMMSLKIAGATGVASVNEFPSMAGVKTLRYNQIFCGAAIIHHRYLMSAAHCFSTSETNRAELINVVVGEIDLATVLESPYTRTYEIQTIILHEQFYTSTKSVRNDIALLRTRLPIEWNRSVGPACLPFLAVVNSSANGDGLPRKPPLPGQSLDTAGWGTTTFGGAQSSLLLKTSLDVLPADQCRQRLRSVPPGVFCTFTPGRDTCQYDSGGALYARYDRLFAVGIVSYGFACAAQQPSVNTRVASFVKWIKTKTPEVSYCVK